MKYYLHRDLSWMYFNHRILEEAQKEEVPLLERLSFLGIYSNNLDEFFRVRMASLNRIAESEDKGARSEQEEARQLIKQINKLNSKFSKEYELAIADVTSRLREENICLVGPDELDAEQLAYVYQFFRQRLNGYLSPVWLSSMRRVADETDENIYLAVKMTKHGEKRSISNYAILALPVSISGRFVRLPDKGGRSYLVYLDDVVRCCLPMIFAGLKYDSFEAYAFKFTRDAEMEIDNDLRTGILQKIAKGVKSRRRGEPKKPALLRSNSKCLTC